MECRAIFSSVLSRLFKDSKLQLFAAHSSALKFPVAFPFGLSFQLTSEMCSIISALGSMLGCKPNFSNSARALKFEMLLANADWSDAIISLCFCRLIAD